MYNGMLHLHSILRWAILILLVIALFRHCKGLKNKAAINAADQKTDLFLMITAHLTFLVGLYQWIAGPWGLKLIQNNGFGEVMKNSQYRFFAVEHLLGMLIGIILITIGRGKVKRNHAWQTHKAAFWLFLIALLIILVVVPWPFREELGRKWLPGM